MEQANEPNTHEALEPSPGLYPRGVGARAALLVMMLIAAFGVRMYRITAPPLDFAPSRQYRSLLLSRAFYVEASFPRNPGSTFTRPGSDVAEWKIQVARANRKWLGVYEPQLMEFFVAFLYHLTGGPNLWAGRVLATLFYVLGGLFLFLLLSRFFEWGTSFVGTAFYLFAPFAIYAGRSFQPESLMLAAALGGMWLFLKHLEDGGRVALTVAVLLAALAMLAKPTVSFFLAGFFVAAVIAERGARGLLRRDVILAAVISVLPAGIYYGSMVFSDLAWHAGGSFRPGMLVRGEFWAGMLKQTHEVATVPALALAVLGTILAEKRLRAVLLGLWASYAAMCFAFTYVVFTHDYYHFMLVPLAALGGGVVVERVLNKITTPRNALWVTIAAAAVLSCSALFGVYKAYKVIHMEQLSEHDVRVAAEIGEKVKHSTKTIFLSYAFGKPLQYHGWIAGQKWPRSSAIATGKRYSHDFSQSGPVLLEKVFNKAKPEYFIVTDLRDLEKQPALARHLEATYPVFARGEGFVIYDIENPKTPTEE